MKNYLIYQDRFRPALPKIKAAKDFREKRAFYIHLDEVIRTLRLDEAFLRESVKAHPHRESEKLQDTRATAI